MARLPWRTAPAWDRYLALLALAVILYTGLFTTLQTLRYRSLFSYEWQDEAATHQIVWNAAHGDFGGQTFLRQMNATGLSDHVDPIHYVLAALYRVRPHITTLFFLRSLLFGLGVFPLYLLAREGSGSPRGAFLLAVMFLCYPPLAALCLGVQKPLTFLAPFLLYLFYFYHTRRFRAFVGTMLICSTFHELFCFTSLAFALLALLDRRGHRWFWAPFLFGLLHYWLAFTVLLPRLTAEGYSPFSQGPGEGRTAGEMLAYALSKPGEVQKLLLQPGRWDFLGHLLAPLLFSPIASPRLLLLALPNLLQILLADRPLGPEKVHWLAPMVPFVYLAAVSTWIRLHGCIQGAAGWSAARRRSVADLAAGLLCVALITSCFGDNVVGRSRTHPVQDRRFLSARNLFDPVYYRIDEDDEIAWSLIARVPPEASVAASGNLLVPLSHRRLLREYPGWNTDYEDVDYLLVQTRLAFLGGGQYECFSLDPDEHERILLRRLDRLLSREGWELVARKGTLLLLRRPGSPLPVGG